jgi:hypothetical protein
MTKYLTRTFLDLIYLEREIENLKIALAEKDDFSITGAFRAFDGRCLTSFNLKWFTEAVINFCGTTPNTRDQARLLFHSMTDLAFGYKEFSTLVVACDKKA